MSNQLEGRLRNFGIFAHFYQPPRETFLPDGKVLTVVPEVNDQIHRECYAPSLAGDEPFPKGFVFSFYTTLREWMKRSYPMDFARIREKILQMPDKEYSVLGDPFIHAILPLLPDEDQDMLLQMGKLAFYADFGFYPKGLWPPETGIARKALTLAHKNGYEFVVLRDSQLENSQQNPMFVPLDEDGEMAVFHFNSGLSRDVSYDEWSTVNADAFLAYWIPTGLNPVAIGTDGELYGHHKEYRDKFLKYLLIPETLVRHGFASLSIKEALKVENRLYTNIKDLSSWSCEHYNLGRWTGECDCGPITPKTKLIRKGFFRSLSKYNSAINQRLDNLDPYWREEFGPLGVDLRDKFFTGGDFLTEMKKAVSREKYLPYAAKLYILNGFTSCGWFFGEDDRVERAIPKTMIRVTGEILRELMQSPEPEYAVV